ncbi:MAG: 2-oxoacid:acceptor oxidoreductase family protein [bacterium]
MEGITEVRWHGRGGQGTVTAAKIFAETATFKGKHVQAFPEYGPERMGAPLKAYNRLSTKPLFMHCQVHNPNIVVVVDATLIKSVDVTEGVPEDGIYLVNTNLPPARIREKMNLKGGTLYTVDATKIAIETLGRPIPNTPLLGALAKVTDEIDTESLIEDIKTSFGKKFSKDVIDANIEAIKRAQEEVHEE